MTAHENEQLTLVQMKTGQTGIVVEVLEGQGLVRRLDALGIRPVKKVTKVSSVLFRGPVTFRVDNAQVAVGFGIAKKIMVEVDKSLQGAS